MDTSRVRIVQNINATSFSHDKTNQIIAYLQFVNYFTDVKTDVTSLQENDDKDLYIKDDYKDLEEYARTSLSISEVSPSIENNYCAKRRISKHTNENSRTFGHQAETRNGFLQNDAKVESDQLDKLQSMHKEKKHCNESNESNFLHECNSCNEVYQNFSKRNKHRYSHCAQPSSYYSQNHSCVSCLNCNNYTPRFQTNSLPKPKQHPSSVRRQLSFSNNSRSTPRYKVYLEKSAKSSNPTYFTCEPGFIALKSGKDQAILFKCTCKNCTKSSCKTYRHSRTSRSNRLSSNFQRSKSSKIKKCHKTRNKKTLSGKSNKSEFSSSTRFVL